MDAEQIFERFFWPHYPEDVRADLARARVTDANPANNPALAAHLEEAARVFVARFPELALDFTDASVHRLSAIVTPDSVDAWAKLEGEVLNVVVHGVAYLGECLVRSGRDARWSIRRPLWESLVTLKSRAGEGELALFQWWLKSLAGNGTVADRWRAHVEVPTMRPEADLEPIAPADRRLPRIAKGVRYDVLYKHLKAHLPELKDLGADFPSPERFAEMRFKWLDFLLLGGGRMLLMYGPGEGGLHLFWLTRAGFEKALFVPCESFPDPIVRPEGDKLIVLTKPATHELLWWGP